MPERDVPDLDRVRDAMREHDRNVGGEEPAPPPPPEREDEDPGEGEEED